MRISLGFPAAIGISKNERYVGWDQHKELFPAVVGGGYFEETCYLIFDLCSKYFYLFPSSWAEHTARETLPVGVLLGCTRTILEFVFVSNDGLYKWDRSLSIWSESPKPAGLEQDISNCPSLIQNQSFTWREEPQNKLCIFVTLLHLWEKGRFSLLVFISMLKWYF